MMLFLLLTVSAMANELILPEAELRRQGYAPYEGLPARESAGLPEAHSLPWPVQFQDAAHTIGNSMAQFQPFDTPPYFHGGCDLRTRAGAEIVSPVSGRLEAGHYGYSTNPDGSMKKFWKPWPQAGDAAYFEVAVISEDGIRYEFHHVNRSTLPADIVARLNGQDRFVTAGTLLGHVIRWMGLEYHHAHYNVILPGEGRVNPEFVSTLLPDSLAPEMGAVFALFADGRVEEFGDGLFLQAPREFVVETQDRQDNNIYVHPPSLARLSFSSGQKTEWDFRETLLSPAGKFPVLSEFFLASLRSPQGRQYRTEGGYGTGKSLVRLAVPAGARGAFTIELADVAGNRAVRVGNIP
jgi:hypothetical protein